MALTHPKSVDPLVSNPVGRSKRYAITQDPDRWFFLRRPPLRPPLGLCPPGIGGRFVAESEAVRKYGTTLRRDGVRHRHRRKWRHWHESPDALHTSWMITL